MGDRYTLGGLTCGHCNAPQEEVYYAPSSGFLDHRCEKCGKPNIIAHGFSLRAATSEEVKQHLEDNGFS
jgi:hypothetical protein